MAKEKENKAEEQPEEGAKGEEQQEEISAQGQVFPTWLYHPKHGGRIFHDAREWVKARKAGWSDSPAKFEQNAE